MDNLFDRNQGTFSVLVNDEGQHSLWPSAVSQPHGWRIALEPTSRQKCVEHIQKEWLDMRPRSLTEPVREDGAPKPVFTLAELFRRQALLTPDELAIDCVDIRLTYHELELRTNQIAHYLIAQGVRPETIVAIALQGGDMAISAILGVLKAGAAYLPVDISYPSERIEIILNDARPMFVLADAAAVGSLPADGPPLIALWRPQVRAEIERQPTAPPEAGERPETRALDAAYVIYTSGSTGTPKGVTVTHLGIESLATSVATAFKTGPGDRVLQFASPSFDVVVWEICMSLLTGAALVLPRDRETLAGHLPELLAAERITHVTLPPSVLVALGDVALPPGLTLIAASERCTQQLAHKWSGRVTMLNAYGPTESTVCATFSDPLTGLITPPIGRPVKDVRAHVLDDDMEPVPVGTNGELYLSGPSLARGYLNRPELTAARFVACPFADLGERMYRTGDIVRWAADGNLHFVGRVDDQVKIRGFRVELGEIEAVLCRHPLVDQAVTVAREETPGDLKLIAYVKPVAGADVDRWQIRNHAVAALPGAP